jgi:hypothetical protein
MLRMRRRAVRGVSFWPRNLGPRCPPVGLVGRRLGDEEGHTAVCEP